MSVKKITALECICERCGHKWKTRTADKPKVCPNCKRENWNEKKK